MATATVLLPPTVLPSSKDTPAHVENVEQPPQSGDWTEGLKSKWPTAKDLVGFNVPCRLEGEIEDLVVLGELPKEIDGSFYRIMVDPFVPPHEGNVPLDGDGNICVFQFHEGKVGMRMRYVETERFLLERRANKAMFGLYRNPYTHHPCVRAAIDSTANTNLVLWAGHLLALKESALPYACDPHTLETLKYDPFGQIKAKTFTAHPKYDPYKDELVVHGYEAKGLATSDVVSYSINRAGKIENVLWSKQPYEKSGLIHDCSITPNWLVLLIWPFNASVERMKRGGHHWAWDNDRPLTMMVIPRKADSPVAAGWKAGEVRSYHFKSCMPIHTGAAWEEEDGTIKLESSRVHGNSFDFFPPEDADPSNPPPRVSKGDYVRWTIDPTKADGSTQPEPLVIVDISAEFPRIDERFMSHKSDITWINVFIAQRSDGESNLFKGLNGIAMHSDKTGLTRWFYAGDDATVQEPIFVPRSEGAAEGDGWVMALVERGDSGGRSELVVLDTRGFERPVAVVQLPLRLRSQIHGNWISAKDLGGYKPITRQVSEIKISGQGALEPL